MDAKEAEAEEQKGNYVKEEPGKGYRRIVAAPKPMDIVEIDAIRALSDADQVVVACGIFASGQGKSSDISKRYDGGMACRVGGFCCYESDSGA